MIYGFEKGDGKEKSDKILHIPESKFEELVIGNPKYAYLKHDLCNKYFALVKEQSSTMVDEDRFVEYLKKNYGIELSRREAEIIIQYSVHEFANRTAEDVEIDQAIYYAEDYGEEF